jgi:hypothetical protein
MKNRLINHFLWLLLLFVLCKNLTFSCRVLPKVATCEWKLFFAERVDQNEIICAIGSRQGKFFRKLLRVEWKIIPSS